MPQLKPISDMTSQILTLHSPSDVAEALRQVSENARKAQAAIEALSSNPLAALAALKFESIGVHPVTGKPLNFIEQINQTFTYLVAIKATELLMQWHPDAEGFKLAPGAHAPRGTLDVESISPGLVGAETFAAVDPNNNGKLRKDLAKLAERTEKHRYSFFMCPKYEVQERLNSREIEGVQVHVFPTPTLATV